MKILPARVLSIISALLIFSPVSAYASAPYLDRNEDFKTSDPYANAQDIGSVSGETAIYGKLQGATPVDAYSFTVPSDGEQTIAFLVKSQEVSAEASPTIILVDPTGMVQNQNLGLELPKTPDKKYTTGVIAQLGRSDWRSYAEPMLGESYSVTSEQRLSLKANETYYIFVFDPSRGTNRYVIHFGDGKAWSFKDVISHFSTWNKVKLDLYGGSSPFTFDRQWLAGLLMVLGFAALLAYWLLQHTFALGSNKSKSFAYLLVKFQFIGRIILISGLWLFLAGWITATAGLGSTGAAFAALLAFIPFTLVGLYEMISLAPKIMVLDVAKREAEVPLELRKKLFISFVIGTVTLLSLATFLAFAIHIR